MSAVKWYRFEQLKSTERFLIRIVYWRAWRRLVKRSNVPAALQVDTQRRFHEIHVRFYEKVVQGPKYVSIGRLTANFLICRANENMRTVLCALHPLNLSAFVHGIRSQIELIALTANFVRKPELWNEFVTMNDDRRNKEATNTVTNINTLVSKLGDEIEQLYHDLSLLLHPNPTALRFYAQAEKVNPNVNYAELTLNVFFEKTVAANPIANTWFLDRFETFLFLVDWFLIYFDSLPGVGIDADKEGKAFEQAATATYIHTLASNTHKFTDALNKAHRQGKDPEKAIAEVVDDLFKQPKKD